MHVTTIFLNMWISIFLTGLFDWNAFMFPVGVKSVHFRFGKIPHREGAFFFWFSSYTRCFLRQISDLVQVELKMVRQIAWREGSVKKVVDRRNVHNIMTTTLHRVECVEKCGILWKCVVFRGLPSGLRGFVLPENKKEGAVAAASFCGTCIPKLLTQT